MQTASRAPAVEPRLPLAEAGHLHRAARGQLADALVPHPVLDEIGDRDDPESVLAAELDEVGHPRHFAVGPHDLADHCRRREARQASEVDRALGLTDPRQHATIASPQREDVPRGDDVP